VPFHDGAFFEALADIGKFKYISHNDMNLLFCFLLSQKYFLSSFLQSEKCRQKIFGSVYFFAPGVAWCYKCCAPPGLFNIDKH